MHCEPSIVLMSMVGASLHWVVPSPGLPFTRSSLRRVCPSLGLPSPVLPFIRSYLRRAPLHQLCPSSGFPFAGSSPSLGHPFPGSSLPWVPLRWVFSSSGLPFIDPGSDLTTHRRFAFLLLSSRRQVRSPCRLFLRPG